MTDDKAHEEFLSTGWEIAYETSPGDLVREIQYGKDFACGAANISHARIDDQERWTAAIAVRVGRERVAETVRLDAFDSVKDVESFVAERVEAMTAYAMGRVSHVDLTKPPATRFDRG